MLLGRQEECRRLSQLVNAARAGESGVLVVRGEPGVGKTSLLDYAAEHAEGMNALSTRGIDSELELGFSSLLDLLRPVLDRLDSLPETQAAALRGALALGPPAGDRLAVAAATLGLLGAVSEEEPLLVLVDDVQWLDQPSEEALLFTARRLAVEGVAFVGAHREGEESAFADAGFPELAVQGLDRDPSDELLARSRGPRVARRVADQLYEETGGNPLALSEIPALLSDEQLAGKEPIEEPLPVGERLRTAFSRRIERLPGDTRHALLVAAASDDERLDAIDRALSTLGLSSADLEAAEEAGLVRMSEGRLVWRHPLIRAAVYGAASGGERRRAHRAVSETDDEERRAWHLAAAAADPDEEVAAALEQAALTSRQRGATHAAARALERAARMSPDDGERARRLLAAANEHLLSGRRDHALGLADEALGLAADLAIRADAQLVRARVGIWNGELRTALGLLLAEAPLVEREDPGRAAAMLVEAAGAMTMAADVEGSLNTARRAVAVADKAGTAERGAAAAFLAEALLLRGETEEAAEWRDKARAVVEVGEPLGVAAITWPLTDLWLERYEEAGEWLERVLSQAREVGAFSLLPFPLAVQAHVDWWAGRWRSAHARARESVRLAEETDQPNVVAWSAIILGNLAAAQGRETDCRRHVALALELADRHGLNAIAIYGAASLGFLELGLGRAEAALRHLEKVARLVGECGLRHPAVVPFWQDLVEAYLLAGRPADSERAIATLEEQADATRLAWPAAVAARCRGLLADDESFENEFLRAFELHDALPTPFERARTELAFGGRLRRARRISAARAPLRSALEVFEHLGAEAWAEKARAELAATGDRAVGRRRQQLAELTGQELEIATLVAEGATNREVAAALFLSPKTVEFHLTKVYAKVGVRSRTELALALVRSESTAGRDGLRD